MLRITETASDDESVTLSVEGRVVGPWAEELEQACLIIGQSEKTAVLDFASVSAIDSTGADILRRLVMGKLRVVNPSPWISDLIEGTGEI